MTPSRAPTPAGSCRTGPGSVTVDTLLDTDLISSRDRSQTSESGFRLRRANCGPILDNLPVVARWQIVKTLVFGV